MRFSLRFLAVPGVAAGVLLGACGPIQSTTAVANADLDIDEAEKAGAAEFAPYEYEKAQAFLTKAKETQGYSEFEQSVVYANHAREAAVQAKDVAEKKKLRAATRRR
jgi:hypothetical protein